MFNHLFKPAWQSASVNKRLDAIDTLDGDNARDQEILGQLALDADESVSFAAIDRISDARALFTLSTRIEAQPTRDRAIARLREIVGDPALCDEKSGLALLSELPEVAVELAAFAAVEAVRLQALDLLTSTDWLQTLENARFTDVRHLIAERLEGIEDMENAYRMLRRRDKKTARLLKRRIDRIHQHEQQLAELAQTAQRLVESAEYLSAHDYLPQFMGRVEDNRRQWAEISDQVDVDTRQRYEKARVGMDQHYQEHQQVLQTQQARKSLLGDIQRAVETAAQRDLETLVKNRNDLGSAVNFYHATWLDLALQTEPEAAEQQHYEQMLQALRSAAHFASLAAEAKDACQALDELRWPSALGEFAAAIELGRKLATEQKARQDADQRHREEVERLHKKISRITRLSRAGHLASARKLVDKVDKALLSLQGQEQQVLSERLQAARKSLEKMDDWKHFATEPKYQQFCVDMEKLVDSDLHPDARSKKIKQLQQQWKTLGDSEVSQQYWPRFKEAADKAYAPCAEFFAERREARQQRLSEREPLVLKMQRLNEDTDWENSPDYQAIQNQVRDISNAFRAIKDVEQKAGQEQWERFKACRDVVYAQLDVEYDRNIAQKRQLLAQMTALADAPATAGNAQKMKALQARWKQVGITRRKDDQKVWKQFREQGDRVYETLKSMRTLQQKSLDEQAQRFHSVTREIHQLAKSVQSLADIDHSFEQLRQQYEELELPADAPEKLVKGLRRDYRKACDQVEQAREKIVRNQRGEQIEALRKLAQLCARLEALGADPGDEAASSIEEEWGQITLQDHALTKRIETRRQAASQPRDLEAIAAARKLFCIRVEIALGQESPPEDRQARMEYQLQQMNESGLGSHQGLDGLQKIEEIEIEWLCMPGADAAEQDKLDKRFYGVISR